MKRAKLKFYRDRAGAHRWRLLAANGRIVAASSEGFRRKAGALSNALNTRALLTAVFSGS